MTKYDTRLKLRAVKAYLRSEQGYVLVGKRFGVSENRLRTWVRSFEVHGANGLRKKFSHYDSVFKLKVLRYMWDNELSYGQTAVHFDIRSAGSVGVWERQYREGGLAQLVPKPRGRPKMPRTTSVAKHKKDEDKSRDELIAELHQLRMEVEFGKKLDALVQAKKDAAQAKKRGSSSN